MIRPHCHGDLHKICLRAIMQQAGVGDKPLAIAEAKITWDGGISLSVDGRVVRFTTCQEIGDAQGCQGEISSGDRPRII
jgi:hypothetical protein